MLKDVFCRIHCAATSHEQRSRILKRSQPLFGAGRRVLCAAGLVCVLGIGILCPQAFAEPVVQPVQTAEQTMTSAAVSSTQLEELSQAAGQSTAQIVGQIEDSLAQQGIASVVTDVSQSILPVVPYALGAGAAFLGMGVFAAAFSLFRKKNSHKASSNHEAFSDAMVAESSPMIFDATQNENAASFEDTASFLALVDSASGSPVSYDQAREFVLDDESAIFDQPVKKVDASTSHGTVSPCDSDDYDELEGFAAGYAASLGASEPTRSGSAHPDDDPDKGPGGGVPHLEGKGHAAREAYAQTDLTMPFNCASSNDESASDFVTTARVLATGSGNVHRVTVPSSHLDFSGMDVIDGVSPVRHNDLAADPLVERDDWQGVALSELRAPEQQQPAREEGLSTDDFVSLIATKAQPAPQVKRQDYVAPVIGPGVDAQAAMRRQELIRASASPAAALLVGRDEEFLANRAGLTGTSVRHSYEGRSEVADGVLNSREKALQNSSRRPGPAAASAISVTQRVGVDMQSQSVAPASSFAPPRPPASRAVVSDRSLAAAVAAASSAYAAFNSYSTMISAPVAASAEVGQGERASRAASYASAVYGAIEQPSSFSRAQATPAYSQGAIAGQPAVVDMSVSDAPVSSAYIDHMVQDEFEHRHDSPAQRNAALGRMQVINGAAVAPVSVRESRHRNRA